VRKEPVTQDVTLKCVGTRDTSQKCFELFLFQAQQHLHVLQLSNCSCSLSSSHHVFVLYPDRRNCMVLPSSSANPSAMSISSFADTINKKVSVSRDVYEGLERGTTEWGPYSSTVLDTEQ
jgi:hypothetical protein